MIVLLRRRYVMAAAVTLLAAAAAAALWAGPSARPAMAGTGRQTIVLDAGHGGEDGGAVSRDGVAESSVNLAITRKLRDVFLFLGRDTVLTREGEEAIYSPDCVTLREKKVSDLKNRVALINQQSGAASSPCCRSSTSRARICFIGVPSFRGFISYLVSNRIYRKRDWRRWG